MNRITLRRLGPVCCGAIAGLSLAGCLSPGSYNLNVNAPIPGLASPGATTPVAVPASGASATPGTPVESSPPTPASDAPDQRQDSVSGFQQVGQGTRIAQTFKTQLAGSLQAVSLCLKAGTGSGQVAVIVRSVDASQHPSETLGGGNLASDGLDESGATWSKIPLDAQVAVVPGSAYAITVTFSGTGSIYVGVSNDTSYPNGAGLTGLTDGSTFWNKLGQDLAFRTYVKR